MRVWLAIVASLPLACCVCAQHPEAAAEANEQDANEQGDHETFPWVEPFGAISSRDADRSLVILAITNDPPAIVDKASQAEATGKKLWCADVLSRSMAKLHEQRPDLRERLVFQPLPVGLPAELTGGELKTQPARACFIICDGSYRLLALSVGVPAEDPMLSLLEDAEEVRRWKQMSTAGRDELIERVATRSVERLSRLWREPVDEMLATRGEAGDGEVVSDVTPRQQAGRVATLAESFEPFYLADVKLRFGLTEASDLTRLAILEQHPQTRRPWCEAMIPFLAGEDAATLWPLLCEVLWGAQPIRGETDAEEWLRWCDTQLAAGPVVLSLQPPLMAQQQPWPPLTSSGKTARRGYGWSDVERLVVEFPHRSIDSQQLYRLIESRQLQPVDIQRPSRARYLWLESQKKSLLVVRESDPPGRFLGRLRRLK